jgi:hypothetical protein
VPVEHTNNKMADMSNMFEVDYPAQLTLSVEKAEQELVPCDTLDIFSFEGCSSKTNPLGQHTELMAFVDKLDVPDTMADKVQSHGAVIEKVEYSAPHNSVGDEAEELQNVFMDIIMNHKLYDIGDLGPSGSGAQAFVAEDRAKQVQEDSVAISTVVPCMSNTPSADTQNSHSAMGWCPNTKPATPTFQMPMSVLTKPSHNNTMSSEAPQSMVKSHTKTPTICNVSYPTESAQVLARFADIASLACIADTRKKRKEPKEREDDAEWLPRPKTHDNSKFGKKNSREVCNARSTFAQTRPRVGGRFVSVSKKK